MIDDERLKAAAKATRSQTLGTLTREEHDDLMRAAITAYLSASAEPVASDMLRLIETMPDDFTDNGNCCAGKIAKEAPNV